MLERYALWLIRNRLWVVVGSLLMAVGIASGARHLYFVDDYRAYFSAENPQLLAFEELENTYTKNDNILFIVSHPSASIFNAETLTALETLTNASWQLPYSTRVDSIINFQHTYAEGDELVVEDLFGDIESFSTNDIKAKQKVALAEPRLLNRIISPDAKVTAVMVTFQMPEADPAALAKLTLKVRQLAADIRQTYPSLEIRLTGELMINTAFQEIGNKDATHLTPLMYLTIILVVALLLKSVVAVVAVVLLVTLSVLVALGAAGWGGLFLTVTSIAAPTMIMTLAIADAIHILVSMFGFMREGKTQNEALISSFIINFSPILITSVTTAVGFLTLNFVDVPPFKDFGNISAMGVIAAFMLSVIFLPAFISCFRLQPKQTLNIVSVSALGWLADVVIKNRKVFLLSMLVIFGLLLTAIPRNEVNNEIVKFFGPEIQFRQDSDYSLKHLTGLYTVEYSLPALAANGVTEPQYLAHLEAFTKWLRKRPEVMHVSALSDIMKRLNQNLHGDDVNWYRLPDSKELASQYLLLYELSLPFGRDLNNEINISKSASRIVVTLGDVSTNEIKSFRDASESWLKKNAPQQFTYGVGASVMFADIFKRSTETMINGVLVGMLIISAILIFALKSLKYGVLSLLPNLLPAGLAFGIWALWVGQVNMAVSLVMTMTLGIIVDDTVHFMSKYLRARRDYKYNSAESVRYAFTSVGLALVVTSVALAAGFAIMAQSDFALNADSSLLTLITIVLALIVDFLFLPPLLMLVDKD